MSATVYSDPHRLPAGVLALVVHGMFFALLYFGFNWNRQAISNPAMSVELWSSLPEQSARRPASPRAEAAVPPPPPPQQKIARPDIAMPEKKMTPVPPAEAKPRKVQPAPRTAETARAKPEAKPAAAKSANALAADQQTAQQQAGQSRQDQLDAENGKVVDEFKAKIHDKIRRNVVDPPGVAKDMRAEFMVTLLPGGAVLKAELVKSSGNAAYDSAVERAILKSDPLPVPPDAQLFNRFRQLDLVFRPEKNAE